MCPFVYLSCRPAHRISAGVRPGRSATASLVSSPKTLPIALRPTPTVPIQSVPSNDSDDESSESSVLHQEHQGPVPLRTTSLLSLKSLASPDKPQPKSARMEASHSAGEITVKYQPKKGDVKNFISEEGSEASVRQPARSCARVCRVCVPEHV